MSKTFNFTDLMLLIKYAKNRNNSKDEYFLFQKYQGELLVRFLSDTNIEIAGKDLLDLGCGFGGYSKAFTDAGANVIGLDLSPINNQDEIPMVSGDALTLPFSDNSFDIVICASLIEHVTQPEVLLLEILRTLKSNGFFYLSFPPFFSPIGGHQFSPYHLLGQKSAIYLSQKVQLYKQSPWLDNNSEVNRIDFSSAYGRWGLYPITISMVKKMAMHLPLKIITQTTRYSPINFSKIPMLREFLTWHVQFVFKKL